MNSDMFSAINQAIKAYGRFQKNQGNSFLSPYNYFNPINMNYNPNNNLYYNGNLNSYNNRTPMTYPNFGPYQMNDQYNRFNQNGYQPNAIYNGRSFSTIKNTNNIYMDKIKNFLYRPI